MRYPNYLSLMFLAVLFTLSGCGQKSADFKLSYKQYKLDNGLNVVLHEDKSDPIVSVAILYHVGSNREKPGKTGFAHFFEHMSFNDSENVPKGANRKMIPELGGTRNGGTWSDGTIYYEVVPNNALELILWMESDRMGYMINTVTEAAFMNQQEVVQNEKRQRVDNNPYGHTNYVIDKNIYPEGHPYNWQVIGELVDLQNATVADVKEFYHNYYGPNNATLVIAGDFKGEDTKKLVEKYFGAWEKGKVPVNKYKSLAGPDKTKVAMVHKEGAVQSVISVTYPINLKPNNPDVIKAKVMNTILGGGFMSRLNMNLREEHAYTYGARSGISPDKLVGN